MRVVISEEAHKVLRTQAVGGGKSWPEKRTPEGFEAELDEEVVAALCEEMEGDESFSDVIVRKLRSLVGPGEQN